MWKKPHGCSRFATELGVNAGEFAADERGRARTDAEEWTVTFLSVSIRVCPRLIVFYRGRRRMKIRSTQSPTSATVCSLSISDNRRSDESSGSTRRACRSQ